MLASNSSLLTWRSSNLLRIASVDGFEIRSIVYFSTPVNGPARICQQTAARVESPCFSDPRSPTERNPKAQRTSPLRMWQGARVQAETLAPPFAEFECLRVLERRRSSARHRECRPFAQIQSRIWAFAFLAFVEPGLRPAGVDVGVELGRKRLESRCRPEGRRYKK